jgi:hypothetical protein
VKVGYGRKEDLIISSVLVLVEPYEDSIMYPDAMIAAESRDPIEYVCDGYIQILRNGDKLIQWSKLQLLPDHSRAVYYDVCRNDL